MHFFCVRAQARQDRLTYLFVCVLQSISFRDIILAQEDIHEIICLLLKFFRYIAFGVHINLASLVFAPKKPPVDTTTATSQLFRFY